jgi:hypothetical protein
VCCSCAFGTQAGSLVRGAHTRWRHVRKYNGVIMMRLAFKAPEPSAREVMYIGMATSSVDVAFALPEMPALVHIQVRRATTCTPPGAAWSVCLKWSHSEFGPSIEDGNESLYPSQVRMGRRPSLQDGCEFLKLHDALATSENGEQTFVVIVAQAA